MKNSLRIFKGTSYEPIDADPSSPESGDLFYASLAHATKNEGFYQFDGTDWRALNQTASDVSNTQSGNLSSTNVQDALVELQGDIDTLNGATGGATTELDNLGTTAINADLIPETSITKSLGSSLLKWANLFIGSVFARDIKMYDGSLTQRSKKSYDSTPAINLLNEALEDNTDADAVKAGGYKILTGSKTAGTGDSGEIILETGTSVGGNRGDIILDANSTIPAGTDDQNLGGTSNRWNNIVTKQQFVDTTWITNGAGVNVGQVGHTTDKVELKATLAANDVEISATRDVILAPTGDINASTNLIKNVVDPIDPQDAATRAYVLANAGSGGAGGSTITKNQVAHGFTILDGIYHNGTSWVAAKADDAETVAVYCVSKVSDVDNFEATKFGAITATAHGKTIGEYYFLDANVSGTPTITAPTSGFSNPLFYVEDVDTVHMVVHRAVDVDQVPTSTVNVDTYNSSDWTDITATANSSLLPTGLGTGSGSYSYYKWKRNGENLDVEFFFAKDGSAGSGVTNVDFPLPNGLVAQTTLSNIGSCQTWNITHTTPSTASFVTSVIELQTTSLFQIYKNGTSASIQGADVLAGGQFRTSFSVPISGWTSTTPSTKVVTQTEIVNPNILINGDCRINQRGAFPVAVAVDGDYYSDRWRTHKNTVAFDISLETTLQPSALSGSKSLLHTCPLGGTGVMGSYQRIEDFSLYKGKTVTLSVNVKSDNSSARIGLYDGVSWKGTSTTHSGSGSWELLKFTTVISSSSNQLEIGIKIGAANFTTTSIAANDYIEFTGAKLELGSTATEFVADSYGDSLRKCQRYYQKSYTQGTTPGSVTAVGAVRGWTQSNALSGAQAYFPVTLRVTSINTVIYDAAGTVNVLSKLDSGGAQTDGIAINQTIVTDRVISSRNFGTASINEILFHYTVEAEL